jgi:ABC-2 type transport system permease protein
MKKTLTALYGSFRAELLQLGRSRALVALAIIQAITFLLLVSLFGLTGSMAPTALINNDNGPYSKIFIKNLQNDHHSFALRYLDLKTATEELDHGRLVAIITIPQNFSQTILSGGTAPVAVTVDNIDADMTDDIQRAMPSAVVAFAHTVGLPNIQVQVHEQDLFSQDTGFIPYLIVSALALDAFVVAGILGAVAVAREFESGTEKMLRLSPIHPLIPIIGRVLAADVVAFCGMLLSVLIVIIGYRTIPRHPIEMIITLLLCTLIFGYVGAMLGAIVKKTLPVASLIFGLALPLYIDSGSLEPERFDGNIIWGYAHLSPIYYAVGILEHAFHGYLVTPESIYWDFLLLIVWAFILVFLTGIIVRRRTST